jgi:signal transduction histidine kinase
MRFPGIYGGVLLVLVFGIIASVAIFALAHRIDSRAREAALSALARDQLVTVQTTLATQFEDVHSLRALLSSIEELSREDFSEFAKDLLSHASGVQALEWVPQVKLAQRAEFERRAHEDGFPEYEFRERLSGDEHMVTAGVRPEYFPVFYLEPLEGNERAFGFDLASDPTRYAAIKKCIETGDPVATSPVTLAQETGEQVGVLVCFPVSEDSEFTGTVIGVLRVGDLLSTALSRLEQRPIEVSIYDFTDSEAPEFMARARGGQLLPRVELLALESTTVRRPVRVADRNWMLVARPTDDYEAASVGPGPLGLLAVGILATLCLAGFLVHRVRGEQRVRAFERELAHLARVATSGEMAASIAHEINQPLCAIVLNAQAAKRMAHAGGAELGPVLDRIVQDGERAGETISNLREFVRDGEVDQRPLDLAKVVRETVEMFNLTDGVEHPVEVRVQPELPEVVANQVQIQQVLLNLFRNAAEAVDDSGSSDRGISLSVEVDRQGRIVTSVDDAGPGVDSGNAKRVFAPFFTTRAQGMGMGLSICKSIIESHGGKIWTDRSPAGGARFSFSLPAMDGR